MDTVEPKYGATRTLVVINKTVAVTLVAAGLIAAAALFNAGATLVGLGAILVGLILGLVNWAAAEAFQIGIDIEEHLRATRQMTKEILRRRDREFHSIDG